MNIKKLFNNEAGVSPIVATLVLVVVAIAGAAAVGTIMGSFSNEVSDSASAGDAAASSSVEIFLGGSSTVYPVALGLAEEYMDSHSGVTVDVASSSSGTGVASAGMGLVDIGAASRDIKPEELKKYPDLQAHKIGASAVVMVINNATGDSLTDLNMTGAEVLNLYNVSARAGQTVPGISGLDQATSAYTVVKRTGDSGTQDTLCDYIGLDDGIMESADIQAMPLDGNAAVADYIAGHDGSIGFVDYGFAKKYDLTIIGVDCTAAEAADEDNVIAAINGETSPFPSGMTRPLNLITLGNPSAIEQSFIDFAKNPSNVNYYEDAGYFAMVDLV
ncbi:MAG: phosphate ABC transporter, solute-binding protein [Methanolobus sp. T82-4]|nr:MAG: phosphate ABC transporter, solute-binding protein [Methanolobus sp. T82-4]